PRRYLSFGLDNRLVGQRLRRVVIARFGSLGTATVCRCEQRQSHGHQHLGAGTVLQRSKTTVDGVLGHDHSRQVRGNRAAFWQGGQRAEQESTTQSSDLLRYYPRFRYLVVTKTSGRSRF